MEKKIAKKTTKQCAVIFLIFGILCIITSFVLGCDKDKAQVHKLPPEGGLIGPITYNDDKTIILIEVEQQIMDFEWSSVTGELLDENKNYLFGFGDEFWSESGVDSEGAWSESVSNFDTKITIPKKGTYYYRISSERSPRVRTPIDVSISIKLASGLALMIAGIIAIIISVVFNQVSKRQS